MPSEVVLFSKSWDVTRTRSDEETLPDAPDVEVVMPDWLAKAFKNLIEYIAQMEGFIKSLQDKDEDIEKNFVGLVEEYRMCYAGKTEHLKRHPTLRAT